MSATNRTRVGENNYFEEKEDVLTVIMKISEYESVNTSIQQKAVRDDWKYVFESKYDWLTLTLTKYQEQPLLLNMHLDDLTKPLTNTLMQIVHLQYINKCTDLSFNQTEDFLQMNAICKIFQLICKVRGYKHVMKFLPHDVDSLEPCFYFLQQSEWFDYSNWESKYVFLLWLRMLCLVPFDICSMDSTVNQATTVRESIEAQSSQDSRAALPRSKLVFDIIAYSQNCLSDTGPTRESAALCLSTLLTRPDMEANALKGFCSHSIKVFDSWVVKGNEAATELSKRSFEIIGTLQCCCQIFKTGHRNKILPYASSVLEVVLRLSRQSNQLLIRKLVTKLIQRIGMTYLPPRVAAWRYQLGQRSLSANLSIHSNTNQSIVSTDAVNANIRDDMRDDDDDNFEVPSEMDEVFEFLLNALGDKDTVVRWSSAKGIGRLASRLPQILADELIAALINQFQQSQAVSEDSDSAWHGGCLALAELARRGALLPSRLDTVVPIIIEAMKYDVVRGYHSVGAHVRDAACYVCWSFARAYSPSILRKYMKEPCSKDNVLSLADSMLTVFLFDREVNCRRAAAAAYQENVGRQGNQNFEFGLEIIAIADYFSLANRKNSYTVLSVSIATLSIHLFKVIWNHLVNNKLAHWDLEIRIIASKALGNLTSLTHNLNTRDIVLKDLETNLLPNCLNPSSAAARHGNMLAVAEILESFMRVGIRFQTDSNEANDKGDVEILRQIMYKAVAVVPEMNRLRLYRGKGSEFLRVASCHLIRSIAVSQIPPSSFAASQPAARKFVASLLESIVENIKQPHESIQNAAQEALRQYLHAYFRGSLHCEKRNDNELPPIIKTLTRTLVDGLAKDLNVAVTRGYALALATLPSSVVLHRQSISYSKELGTADPLSTLTEILTVLKTMSDVSRTIAGEPDPETRRNCLQAAADLAERTLLFLPDIERNKVIQFVWNMLVEATDDYSSDKRGDTGSWSRIVALQSLQRLAVAIRNLRDDMDAIKCQSDSMLVGGRVYTSFGVGVVAEIDHHAQMILVEYTTSLNNSEESKFQQSNRKYFQFSSVDILTKENCSILSESPLLTATYPDSRSLQEQLLKLCLRQAAEKLDSVRVVAGRIIERLVLYYSSDQADVAYSLPSFLFPQREIFASCLLIAKRHDACDVVKSSKTVSNERFDEEAGAADEDLALQDLSLLQWGKASFVFPYLRDLLIGSPDFALCPILSGLILSIGGLTETLAKEAMNAIIGFHSAIRENKRTFLRIHRNFLSVILEILRVSTASKKAERSSGPVIKTIDLLLRHSVLKPNDSAIDYQFLIQAQQCIMKVSVTTMNVTKIRSSIEVLGQLVASHGTLRFTALAALINLLGHRFPKIRSYVAETLYLLIISDPFAIGDRKISEARQLYDDNRVSEWFERKWLDLDIADDRIAADSNIISHLFTNNASYDQIANTLTTFPWSEVSIAQLQLPRHDICKAFDVNFDLIVDGPATRFTEISAARTDIQEDELDSYSALVRDAGY